MRIESGHSDEVKRRFKVVCTDDYADVPGEIITADEATGECLLLCDGETRMRSFGPGGIRIVRRFR